MNGKNSNEAAMQVDNRICGATYEQDVHDFWCAAVKRAWSDDSFYRELRAKPLETLKKMASDLTQKKGADTCDALHRSIEHETRGARFLERMETPEGKDYPIFKMTPVAGDDNAEDPSDIYICPPTCC